MKLSAENVRNTFMNCLFNEGEITDKHIVGTGIRMNVGFHPERLKESENQISEMLSNLPLEFHANGGGASFLNMCNDAGGEQWADLHETMDQLLALGTVRAK